MRQCWRCVRWVAGCAQATEDVQQGLTQDDFDMYYETWEKFDEAATQYIPLSALSEFVDTLEEPLRLPAPNLYKLVSLNIPTRTDGRTDGHRTVALQLRSTFPSATATACTVSTSWTRSDPEYKLRLPIRVPLVTLMRRRLPIRCRHPGRADQELPGHGGRYERRAGRYQERT